MVMRICLVGLRYVADCDSLLMGLLNEPSKIPLEEKNPENHLFSIINFSLNIIINQLNLNKNNK